MEDLDWWTTGASALKWRFTRAVSENPNSFYPKVGKYNGLPLLLDAETYDYMYQAS